MGGGGGHSDPGNPGGRGGQKTLPSVGGVWIFSGITQFRTVTSDIAVMLFVHRGV